QAADRCNHGAGRSSPPWRSPSSRAAPRCGRTAAPTPSTLRCNSRRTPTKRSVASVQVEDEVELRAGGVVVLERHPTARVSELARASGDGEDGVAGVRERPFHGDLAAGQERGPVALPGLADDDPNAVALVAADLARVCAVEDVVREREDVAREVRVRVAVRD